MSAVIHIALPVTLFCLMFAMGLRLSTRSFVDLLPRWPLVLAVLGSLVVVLPAVAIAIVRLSGLSPELGLGVVLISATPVGTFSSILASYGRANLALSVSLTALTSLLAVVTLPLIVNVAAASALATHVPHLPWADTVLRVLLLIGLPVTLGMLVQAWFGDRADRWHVLIKNVGAGALVLIFAAIIYAERHELLAALSAAWLPVVLLNGAALALGLIFRRMLAPQLDIGLSVALAHTIRQEETGLYVALTLLAIPLSALPLLLNSLVGITCGLAVLALARLTPTRATTPPISGLTP
jgi:BASS family bile acid:Na+ symporter